MNNNTKMKKSENELDKLEKYYNEIFDKIRAMGKIIFPLFFLFILIFFALKNFNNGSIESYSSTTQFFDDITKYIGIFYGIFISACALLLLIYAIKKFYLIIKYKFNKK